MSFIDARKYGSKGLIHPDHASGYKVGLDADYYLHGTGNKAYGKVTKNNGKDIHFRSEKNGTFSGPVHKYKVSSNLPESTMENTYTDEQLQEISENITFADYLTLDESEKEILKAYFAKLNAAE